MRGSLITATYMWVIIAIAIAAGVWIIAFSGLTGAGGANTEDQASIVARTIASAANSLGPVHSGEVELKGFIVSGAWDIDVVKKNQAYYVKASHQDISSEVPVLVKLKETDTIYDARGIKAVKSPEGIIELVKRT